MAITLVLESMTVEEKIETMECIWDDLCKNVENIQSPSWHGRIIEEREERVKEGKEKFLDWETAKIQIKNSIRL